MSEPSHDVLAALLVCGAFLCLLALFLAQEPVTLALAWLLVRLGGRGL